MELDFKLEEGQKRKSPQMEWGLLMFLTLAAVGLIGYIDAFAPVEYLYKASGKAVLFLGIPLLYWRANPYFSYKTLFRYDKSTMKWAVLLGAGVFSVVVGSYFATTSFVDLSMVTGELDSRLHIDGDNFILVAVYIATCNSLLEEFFFRGFLFFRLKDLVKPVTAHITSSIIFALYHVGIMLTWFDWWVFALCMVALVIGGVIFNLLDEKSQTLYPSWFCHACANIGINLVGGILFYL